MHINVFRTDVKMQGMLVETTRLQTLLTSFHSGLFISSFIIIVILSFLLLLVLISALCFSVSALLSLETSVRFTIGASEVGRWFDTKRHT
jgi:hypothetical protein